MEILLILICPIVIIGFFILIGLRIVDQYERGVVLTLGKYTSTRSPGLVWVFVGIQRMMKVDLRITTTDIPQQEVITKDNVPVGINAVVYFQVQNAENALLNIKDYTTAVSQYAQAALRDVIGAIELDPLHLIISETTHIVYPKSSFAGKTGISALSARSPCPISLLFGPRNILISPVANGGKW